MTAQEDLLSKPALTVEEAGRVLGVSRNTAYKAVKNGDIPSVRVAGMIRIPGAKLREMLGCVPVE